ncbi:flagellar basal body-associated protein FliL-like protein [Thiorhodovibrio litoralis]|nr:flagellar basal body-associated protein FliL-like protein [Thiorhodovibrio litoralis]
MPARKPLSMITGMASSIAARMPPSMASSSGPGSPLPRPPLAKNLRQSPRLRALLLLLLLALPLPVTTATAWAQPALQMTGNYPGYVSMGPYLIVNLASEDAAKFLRLDIDFYVLNAQDNDVIQQYGIAIRDRLITLLGGRDMEVLQGVEGREALRKETLEALRETLMRFAGNPAIQDLYFTAFVMQ